MGDIPLRGHGKIIHPVNSGKRGDKGYPLYIHHRLHADLPQLDTHLLQRAGDPVGKGPPQDRRVEDPPLLPQAQKRHLLLNIDHAEKTTDPLA